MKVDLRYAGKAPTSTDGVDVIRFVCNGRAYEIRPRKSADGFQLQVCEPLGEVLLIVPGGTNTILVTGKEQQR